MSTIQPQEKLKLLRELLLVEERHDIASLRESLVELEREVDERGKNTLVDDLREQKPDGSPAYEAYIAALQDGTESAIERSVHTNKTRLAGALFPIMGPAIRSYVAELFRSMAEELNRTLQNATSIERLKWRFQARVSGVPFSEYVALRTADFRVEELYLMEQGTGLLIQHLTADPDHETLKDPDLMSGMLTAIRSFTRDVFGEDNNGDGEPDQEEELNRFSFGGRQVLIEGSPAMVLAAVVRGSAPSVVREKMRTVLEALHGHIGNEANSEVDVPVGEASQPSDRSQILEGALLEAHGKKSASSGGGLWRAWLFLALVAAGIGYWVWTRISENQRWQEFADNLRAAPGIEVLEADGPRIVGLRDPEAAYPISLAPENADLEKADLRFAPFHSLHPPFVEARQADAAAKLISLEKQASLAQASVTSLEEQATASTAALEKLGADLAAADEQMAEQLKEAETRRRNQIENLLTSRFAHLDGVEWQFNDEGIQVSGGAPEPYYSQIVAQVAAIDTLGSVDSSGLKNLSGTTMEQVVEDFTRSLVLYESGSLELLAEGATVGKLERLIDQLDAIAERLGDHYGLRVRSHPLIGANREANKVIEQERANDLRRRLIQAGVAEERLTLELSEDLSKSGHGVEVVPVKIEP